MAEMVRVLRGHRFNLEKTNIHYSDVVELETASGAVEVWGRALRIEGHEVPWSGELTVWTWYRYGSYADNVAGKREFEEGTGHLVSECALQAGTTLEPGPSEEDRKH